MFELRCERTRDMQQQSLSTEPMGTVGGTEEAKKTLDN
jgi:hypothetical protein